ncbi:uncharacterized protein [Paralichthys olivaceus]|uniref:uncharacterized protein isoform X2 n=1 Tax=Paralichthys olivaceus TaxID=8255 RepID=UPI003751F19D
MSAELGRMNRNQDDEFVAVRVQDPRVQNEGSWNSYVDFKIFLHTNSKAFTAKTSCVRRRYSEFVWLKKKMQKNAGLVPVPDLPGKSFFSFSNEDFLERRRTGLQAFLDKVVNMTVCLSDSQLHLFLQTQLPVGHIQDCVQGHTPYSVTDAILTYASSNWGWAQAQEDDTIKEPSLTVSYESMESPAPHQPTINLQTAETFRTEPVFCGDSDPLAGLLERRERDETELRQESSIKFCQESDHLEAVVERDREPAEATFYLGDGQDEQMSCQIQTPVEVHSPVGPGFERDCELEEESSEEEESVDVLEEKTVSFSEMEVKTDQLHSPEEANLENVACEPEQCIDSVVTVDFKDNDSESEILESNGRSQEEVLENLSEDDFQKSDEQQETEESSESASEEETTLQSEIQVEAEEAKSVPEVDGRSAAQPQMDQVEVDSVGTKDESDEDTRSLPSSNESIVKVSDEESVCDETDESIEAVNGFAKMSDVDASSQNILDLQLNGFPVEKDDLRYLTALDVNSTAAGGDLTESGDFSVLESSCVPGAAEGKCAEEETRSSVSLEAAEETHEVQV